MPNRQDKRGRSTTALRHVRLYHWVLNSLAWHSLDVYARALYVAISAKYNGRNNGEIIFSCRQAMEGLHISRGQASISFRKLEERGFIKPVIKGGFNRKGNAARNATIWRLTEFLCDVTHTFPTKDFMRWQPPQKLEHGSRSEPFGSTDEPAGPRSEPARQNRNSTVHSVN
jgi:hypothetical protein